jgi:hypothetical protein
MLLFVVFLPLVNFLLFLVFGRLVSTKTLASIVIGSMFTLLAGLIYAAPSFISGISSIATLGV